MPYRNMNLEDFATYVGMDAREVRRLADRGRLPAEKVAGQWRFNRARVTEWLQQTMQNFDPQWLETLERSLGAVGSETLITDLIGLQGVEAHLRANTRASVLRELVKLAEHTGLLYDPQWLLGAIEQREAMCSTALPNGVAIPHPRQPNPNASAEPFVCVARLSRGIAFGAPDRELTRLFVLICCHEDRHHLSVLARLMRILDEQTISNLLEVEESEHLLQALIDREQVLSAG